MTNRLKLILPVLLVFLLANLACNFPTGEPTPPPLDRPVDEVPLEPTIVQDETQGLVSVTLTEDQLTAYMVQELSSNPDVPLTEPRVVLQNGQAELYGKLQQGPVTADTRVVFTVDVDQNGALAVNVVSADVGNVPVPEAMRDQLAAAINQNLNASLAPEVTGMKVQSVMIGDGTLTVSGTRV